MPIQSPMSNLRDVLAQVKETAATYQSQFQNNEAATRLALIDPVLTALGWSMANPKMVVVENTGQLVRADYVLYDSAGSPSIVVEAKALGGNVSSSTPQLFATMARIQTNQRKMGFITNGLKWEHYVHGNALMKYSLVWSEDIASSDLQTIAAHLIQSLDVAQFWPQEADTTAPEILQLQRDYSTLKQDYDSLELRVAAFENGKPPPPPKPVPVVIMPPNWEDLDKLPGNMSNTVPSKIRLPDQTEKDVSSWRQALLVACETVLNSNPQLTMPFPDKAGRSINLINTVEVPRSVPATTPSGVTVFIHLNYPANGSVANIKHILAQMPANQQVVKPAVVFAKN